MRTIKTTPGLGDTAWVLQKLINAREKFHWQIHDGPPRRGKQMFDLLPMVGDCTYTPGLPYNYIKARNVTRMARTWNRVRLQTFCLEANTHLEAGRRIEEFLPDLPTSYTLPFQTQEWTGPVYDDFVLHSPGLVPLIGIYASSYATSRNWGFWQAREWFELISALYGWIPEAKFVIIGADWDAPLAQELMGMLRADCIPFIDTIGKPLGYVIEVMKILEYAFYFPSGLGIISGLLARPSIMFYNPTAHARLPGTWADPALLATGKFKEMFFCTPAEALTYAKDEYKLEEKL